MAPQVCAGRVAQRTLCVCVPRRSATRAARQCHGPWRRSAHVRVLCGRARPRTGLQSGGEMPLGLVTQPAKMHGGLRAAWVQARDAPAVPPPPRRVFRTRFPPPSRHLS
jgi:hypothetical protein